jgi:hypothetical protein
VLDVDRLAELQIGRHVKKIDPTKKVTPMAGRGADAHCDTNAASAKHSDPIAKSSAIHHEARSGRHQTPPRGPARPCGAGASASAPGCRPERAGPRS